MGITEQHMKAVVFGAGNIGRGFIGQLLYDSGYEIVFIDVDRNTVDCLNKAGYYEITLATAEAGETRRIGGVRAVDVKNTALCSQELACADIAATAVGVNALPAIVPMLAAGIRERMRSRPEPLNIILCDNKIGADRYMETLVKELLTAKETAFFDTHIGFLEASVERMVTSSPSCAPGMLTRITAEDFNTLPVDAANIKGALPPVAGVEPFSPFDFYIYRKIYMHNMSHAMTAYLGFLRGYLLLCDAAGDPLIRDAVRRALDESAGALKAEFGPAAEGLDAFAENLISRYGNRLLGDTVLRVGRDTRRKLSPSDRLAGALAYIVAHGGNGLYLSLAIAAALRFCPADDPASGEVAGTAAEQGAQAAVEKYAGMAHSAQTALIARLYEMLGSAPLASVLEDMRSGLY